MLGKSFHRSLALLLLLLLASALAGCAQPVQPENVLLLTVDGSINPITADYLNREIAAVQGQAGLIVIELNTPGGSDSSMREIIQAIQMSSLPVVSFVYPSGSRAASAGTFIVYASTLAAMAPGTSIGAAHPVLASGAQPDPTMDAKMTNDAASLIVSLAQRSGRNAQWAEQAVRESASLPAEEAVQQGVVDYLATDLADLMRQLDGKSISWNSQSITLHTVGAPLAAHPPTFWDRFLEIIANPNLAYIFFLVGIFALIAEVFHPTVVAGVLGVISLILALLAMESLPVNIAGILLIVVSAVLFILEIKVPGFGILGAGGIVAFILGSLLLFNPQGFPLELEKGVSLWLVGGFVAFSLVFFFGVIAAAIRLRSRPKMKLGMDALISASGVASSGLNPKGTVQVAGSYWQARSVSGQIQPGQSIQVVGQEGLELIVEKEPDIQTKEGTA